MKKVYRQHAILIDKDHPLWKQRVDLVQFIKTLAEPIGCLVDYKIGTTDDDPPNCFAICIAILTSADSTGTFPSTEDRKNTVGPNGEDSGIWDRDWAYPYE